jgi:hypothetical protein
MAQIFGPAADLWFRIALLAVPLAAAGAFAVAAGLVRSDYLANVDDPPPQPVPFSHQHHAGELGIDCRYCHASVELSPQAGLPATSVCMTCHAFLWTGAPMLAPVRDSMASGRPIRWRRVARLPDFVYFDHSIHLAKGVGCSTCHGRVDQMPLMRRAEPFEMQWCLACHRDPAAHLRPLDKVFDMAWTPPENQAQVGAQLAKQYGVDVGRITHCYICHR